MRRCGRRSLGGVRRVDCRFDSLDSVCFEWCRRGRLCKAVERTDSPDGWPERARRNGISQVRDETLHGDAFTVALCGLAFSVCSDWSAQTAHAGCRCVELRRGKAVWTTASGASFLLAIQRGVR